METSKELLTMYPEEILEYVRQSLDLESDDTSRDDEIAMMTREEVLDRVATWNGLIGFGDTIREWVEGIYNIILEN